MKLFKKAVLLFLGLSILGVLFAATLKILDFPGPGASEQAQLAYSGPANSERQFSKINEGSSLKNRDSNLQVPESLNLDVPFTPQAPTANWDTLHNEACEEAAAIMANAFFSNTSGSVLKPDIVEVELAKLTSWQKAKQGYFLDQTSQEVATMMEKVYGLKVELKNDLSEQEIKQNLAENKLVAVSTNGQLLNNPYYKQPGPIHHMLVLRGFKQGKLITNDSGTKRGQAYLYDFPTIQKAAGDWNHAKQSVMLNNKIYLIISK